MVLVRFSPDQTLEHAMKHSYRNFHAEGLDYVCLHRTPDLTVKAYFFDGASTANPQVVHPHTHRYDFATTVLRGGVRNVIYWEEEDFNASDLNVEIRREKFRFYTPLNGGAGFRWSMTTAMGKQSERVYGPGDRWVMGYDQIHTLMDVRPRTILLLHQYKDVLPLNQPTATYTHSMKAPSLVGLYSAFDRDTFISRLGQLEELCGGILQKYALHTACGIPFSTDF
jgi:hypothetical protein